MDGGREDNESEISPDSVTWHEAGCSLAQLVE
jgi:hypothetical protein